ncbi:MAG: SOS response-associated peptidase [Burkholderiales bacterium]|nr:SOS response-associated peptidase [Opitutaceae bacterium]
MCTRFLLEQDRLRALAASLGLPASASALLAPLDRFNIAPGKPIAALRSFTGAFHPRWGFAAREDQAPLTNARAETLALKPTFRDAFRERRCLVPASGFYEWEKRGRARLPWLFRRHDEAAFCFAALWEKSPAGEPGVVIVTTPPNALMAPLHHRMPALFASAEACRVWLDPQATERELAALLAEPADADAMTATPVSPRMNRVEFDSPECIVPAVHGLAARDAADGDAELFG